MARESERQRFLEGLSSLSDAPQGDLEALYDGWADGYDADLAAWDYRAPDEVAARLAALRIDAGGAVLDAGCGTGGSGAALRSAGFTNIVGIDLSHESLARARTGGAYRSLIRVDLMRALPFADDRFEAVVSVGVFTHVTYGRQLLTEFLRVVRPGGSIVFSQRTDLWHERSFESLLSGLEREGVCSVRWSEPQPYLPDHPEYGDEIEAIYVEMRARA